MFQITVSVDKSKADWLYSVEDISKSRLENCSAVSALHSTGNRIYCGFGCEYAKRAKLVGILKDCIVETFAVVAKFEFIKQHLSIYLKPSQYEMLVHTLVAFDRENEHKLLRDLIKVEDGLTLDGVFNFRLSELKSRWLEICKLTVSNGAYLRDDETYNELLRFLISAVNPKINNLTVSEHNGVFRLVGRSETSSIDINVNDSMELMYYIIDLAPLELTIDGALSNVELSRNLVGIFDAKTFT